MNVMKAGPMCHKISVLRKALARSSSPRHRRQGLALFKHFNAIKPGPLSYKLRMLRRVLEGEDPHGRRLAKNRHRHAALPMLRMSIVAMQPSHATSPDYREGHLGMTSVVVDLEDLGRTNLERLGQEHEVEVEERGRWRVTRRVDRGMVVEEEEEEEEGEKKDASVQTNLRMKIWLMPTRLLPLRHYQQRQQKQKKQEDGGPS